MTLVWGVHPEDKGSLNCVYEYTDARLDTSANFTSKESQLWLHHLCSNLTQWADEPQGPIVAGSVECPFPQVEQITAARNLSLPLPSEVCCLALRCKTFNEHSLLPTDAALHLTPESEQSANGPIWEDRGGLFIAGLPHKRVKCRISQSSFQHTALLQRACHILLHCNLLLLNLLRPLKALLLVATLSRCIRIWILPNQGTTTSGQVTQGPDRGPWTLLLAACRTCRGAW